jgi:hypothetical protein
LNPDSLANDLEPPLIAGVEVLEKVLKKIVGLDVEKNGLTECAKINNFMLGKSSSDLENIVSHWSGGLFLQAL